MNLCQYVQVLFRCTQEIDSQNFSHNLFDNFNQKHLDLSILQFCWHYFLPKCFIPERSILYDQSSSTTNEMSPSWTPTFSTCHQSIWPSEKLHDNILLEPIVPSTNCSILWTSWAESKKIFWNSSGFIQRDDNTIFSFS